MEFAFDFAKNIVIYTIFANLWEMMIPEGRFAGYIRLVLGFVLVAVILQPVSKLFDKDTYDLFEYEIKLADKQLTVYGEKWYDVIEKEFAERIVYELNSKHIANIVRCETNISFDTSGKTFINEIILYSKDPYNCDPEKIAEYLGFERGKLIVRNVYEDN